MKIAIYPGSFDPVTNGHIDIIRRAAQKCDKLYVAVLINKAKKSMFSVDERVEMLEHVLNDVDNVEVISYEGLLVELAKERGASVIFRGLRAVTDFEFELQLAQTNSVLSDGKVDTLFLTASLRYAYLSSSTVKEVASFNGDISKFVPEYIENKIRNKYKGN